MVRLYAQETWNAGEIEFELMTDSPDTYTLLVSPENFDRMFLGFQEVGTYDAPGLHRALIENEQWQMVVAVTSGGEVSNLVRLYPRQQEPHYYFDVIRHSIQEYVVGRTPAYRMRIEVKNPINITTKVFLYRREVFRSLHGEERDVFLAVCKPGDLEMFPEDDVGDTVPPFFRLDAVDLVEDNIFNLEASWEAIRNDLRELVLALEANHDLGFDGIYPVWSYEQCPGSSSMSAEV